MSGERPDLCVQANEPLYIRAKREGRVESGRFRQLRMSSNWAALSSVDHATPDTLAAGGALLHEQVHSSNVRSVGYSQEERVLEVAFHSGGVYRYDNVPADVHAALMAASSKGGFLARFVKGRYPYRHISG
jgi:hypothetical protein